MQRLVAALRELATGRRGRLWQILFWLVLVLLVLRLLAPVIITGVLNQALQRPGRYRGSVQDVSLALWRSHYTVHDLRLQVQRRPGEEFAPLLEVRRTGIGLDWGALVSGRLVARVRIEEPTLHLVPTTDEEGEESVELPAPEGEGGGRDDERWQDKVAQLAALRVDAVEIVGGRVDYADDRLGYVASFGSIEGSLRDLAVGHGAERNRSSFRFAGDLVGDGRWSVEGDAQPLAERPTFAVKAAVESLNLAEVNHVAQHFEGLFFNRGIFSGYLELRCEQGRLDGYFKPLFKDLDIASFRQDRGNAATRLFWRIVVPVAENVLDNEPTDRHAARVPIEGELTGPQTDLWSTIGSVLRNAFVRAIVPGFDGAEKAEKKEKEKAKE